MHPVCWRGPPLRKHLAFADLRPCEPPRTRCAFVESKRVSLAGPVHRSCLGIERRQSVDGEVQRGPTCAGPQGPGSLNGRLRMKAGGAWGWRRGVGRRRRASCTAGGRGRGGRAREERAGVRGGEWGADPGLQTPLARWLTLGRAAEQAWEPRASSGRPHLSEPHWAAARRVSAGRGPGVAAWVRRARRVPKRDKGLGARGVGWLRAAVGREGHRRPGPGLRTGSRLGREPGRVLRDTRAVGHLY